jgi:peptidoglycan-N-acetylglucosamine deacetylase
MSHSAVEQKESAVQSSIPPSAWMKSARIVTTSWDDGAQSDLKIAERLRYRKVRGTFYVPISPYDGRVALSRSELRALSSEGFEIGAHGFSHKHLWGLSDTELDREISPCKPMLEDIVGAKVGMFCYPRGRYDSKVVQALQAAGYAGARTVRMLTTSLKFQPFEMPTTLQVFPHRRSAYLKNVARARFRGMSTWLAQRSRLGNWVTLGKNLFDSVMEHGGVWHLYGHSWEIEELNLWRELEEILDYVAGREGVLYVPNGELLSLRRP